MAISMPTHNDEYWHKSLECVFQEINDQAQDSVSILRQLRPDVIRELGHHPSSTIHGDILRFIDENCGPDENTTQWTCTWAKIHSIIMVLNRNVLVLDSSDDDVKAEDESSIHDEHEEQHGEITTQFVEDETEVENQNEEPRSDEDDEQEDIPIYPTKKLDIPVDEPIDGYFSKECQLVEDTDANLVEDEPKIKDDLKRENSVDSFVQELERMELTEDTV